MNNLSIMKCSACSGETKKLNLEEINFYLKKINNWILNKDQNMISKKYNFKNFKKSLKFTNIVAEICEQEMHHADIAFGFNYVLLMIHTYATNSITLNDFILAAKIDKIDLIKI